MRESPKCPYCGATMALHLNMGFYSYYCPSCYAEAPAANSLASAYAAAMKRDRVKGSMSLYIYKKLEEWLGAPCNLSFGELSVSDFFTRYCGNFCDDCNSEYEKCWKKFFETLEETESSDE